MHEQLRVHCIAPGMLLLLRHLVLSPAHRMLLLAAGLVVSVVAVSCYVVGAGAGVAGLPACLLTHQPHHGGAHVVGDGHS